MWCFNIENGPYKATALHPCITSMQGRTLPESVRSAVSLASFKRKLKTYLFNISF